MTICVGFGSICCGPQPKSTWVWRIRRVSVPAAVQRRLVWRDVSAADELLGSPPFERAGKAPRAAGAGVCTAAR